MHPRLAVPLLAMALLAATGCDLVSEPEGPRPEDFEVQEETSEVRTSDVEQEREGAEAPQDVAVPRSAARGGVTLGFTVPR